MRGCKQREEVLKTREEIMKQLVFFGKMITSDVFFIKLYFRGYFHVKGKRDNNKLFLQTHYVLYIINSCKITTEVNTCLKTTANA